MYFVFKPELYFLLQDRSYETNNILDRFDRFLVEHSLVAKVPSVLSSDGPLAKLVPRSFVQPEPIAVPLAATGINLRKSLP